MMPLFVFDPVGNLAANRIKNEPHTVTSINGADYNYFIPNNAPFYDSSMVVIDVATGEALIEGVDYFTAISFEQATDKVGSAISGAVVLADVNRTGNFLLNYQTLGGEYVNDETRAIESGLEALVNLANRKWENIVNVPATFPPTPHAHRLDNVVGVSEILASLTTLEAAIKSPSRHITMSDIVDIHEGYVEPLTQSMANIAASIMAIANVQTTYYVEINNAGTSVTVPTVAPDVWTDSGVVASPNFDGTYLVLFSGNPTVVGDSGSAIVDFRFIVNDQPISHSTLLGSTVGLGVGHVVKLQFKLRNTVTSDVIVAGDNVSCGLTLLRVSD